MRITFQLALALLIGLGTIYAGIISFYSPLYLYENFYQIDLSSFNNQALLAIESQTRLLAGMWVASGIVLLACIPKFESNRNVLWLVFLGLSLGAIGELLSVINLDGNIQAAAIKACISIGLCVGMEASRIFVIKKCATK
mgnify:CR=1 FL=1